VSFEIVGEISQIETFAVGSGIRETARLHRLYGRGRWRKRKGIACHGRQLQDVIPSSANRAPGDLGTEDHGPMINEL
jgi:hypothetical protein